MHPYGTADMFMKWKVVTVYPKRGKDDLVNHRFSNLEDFNLILGILWCEVSYDASNYFILFNLF